jgi:hypothetical protein
MTFKDALHVIMGEDSSSHYSAPLVEIISHVGAFLTFQKELQPIQAKMALVKAQKGTPLITIINTQPNFLARSQ